VRAQAVVTDQSRWRTFRCPKVVQYSAPGVTACPL
jgi:hypothetical protein